MHVTGTTDRILFNPTYMQHTNWFRHSSLIVSFAPNRGNTMIVFVHPYLIVSFAPNRGYTKTVVGHPSLIACFAPKEG